MKRARRLRKEQTLAERALWEALRQKKMNFRRQVPIGRFIADFAHHESKLLIEIDGYFHTIEGAAERDVARTARLTSEGFRVIRIKDDEVLNRFEQVVEQIVAETLSPPSPTLPPSKGEGRRATGPAHD